MAEEILDSIESGKVIKHEVHHDIASFLWVLPYCIMRKAIATSKVVADQATRSLANVKISNRVSESASEGKAESYLEAKAAKVAAVAERDALIEAFYMYYGRVDVRQIWDSRHGQPFKFVFKMEGKYTSEGIKYLMAGIAYHMAVMKEEKSRAALARWPKYTKVDYPTTDTEFTKFNHQWLLSLLDRAIELT